MRVRGRTPGPSDGARRPPPPPSPRPAVPRARPERPASPLAKTSDRGADTSSASLPAQPGRTSRAITPARPSGPRLALALRPAGPGAASAATAEFLQAVLRASRVLGTSTTSWFSPRGPLSSRKNLSSSSASQAPVAPRPCPFARSWRTPAPRLLTILLTIPTPSAFSQPLQPPDDDRRRGGRGGVNAGAGGIRTRPKQVLSSSPAPPSPLRAPPPPGDPEWVGQGLRSLRRVPPHSSSGSDGAPTGGRRPAACLGGQAGRGGGVRQDHQSDGPQRPPARHRGAGHLAGEARDPPPTRPRGPRRRWRSPLPVQRGPHAAPSHRWAALPLHHAPARTPRARPG